MTKTKNLNLPQWEASDQVQRSDFNDAFASLDEGYCAMLETAQETKEIVEQVQAVAYQPGNLPYAVGSYTGTGADLEITVGFRPSFVVISGKQEGGSGAAAIMLGYDICTAGNVLSGLLSFTDTGFRLTRTTSGKYPALSVEDHVYDYIAFR
jgi:hypothetical protein